MKFQRAWGCNYQNKLLKIFGAIAINQAIYNIEDYYPLIKIKDSIIYI